MDSQTDSGVGTVSTESPSSNSQSSSKSTEFEFQQSVSSTYELITSQSIDQFDPFGGDSLNAGWDSSYLQFSDNNPMPSSTAFHQNRNNNQIETLTQTEQHELSSQDSIVTPSFGCNSNYIAFPRGFTSVDSSIEEYPSITVSYYFSVNQNDDSQSNPEEWSFFDPNGTRVDNPALLGPTNDQPDIIDLTGYDVDFDIEPTSRLVQWLNKYDPNSETISSLMTEPNPNPNYDNALNVEPQLPINHEQVISNPIELLNSIQLNEQSTEPSMDLGINMFPASQVMPHPVVPKKLTKRPKRPPVNQIKFPEKLWAKVNDDDFPQLKWSSGGHSIKYKPNLIEPVLTRIIRSPKLSSFVRQLHMYGFRKPKDKRLKGNRDRTKSDKYIYYQNPLFSRDHPELVDQIQGRVLNPYENLAAQN